MLAVAFAGEPVVLVRAKSGGLFALEDRCAHRQVPLHAGVVCGESVQCGYHGWTYGSDGKCAAVPYLGKNQTLPNGVRSYPCREAYGFVFIFPGDPALADARFPDIPTHADPGYKTRTLDREIPCHYSFMHENLMDMNHQFLHRKYMGSISAVLLDLKRGPGWIEASYRFERAGSKPHFGERFMIEGRAGEVKKREHDVMTIRTQYPYQILRFLSSDQEKPSLDLWLAYVPVDRRQRINRTFGLMMIRKPSIPGLIHLLWPFIGYFTESIFAQDHWIVELEQKAHDAQGGDWNQEIFPVIRGLRDVLIGAGVPLEEPKPAR